MEKRVLEICVEMLYRVKYFCYGVYFDGQTSIESGAAGFANLATFIGEAIRKFDRGEKWLKDIQINERICLDVYIELSGFTANEKKLIIDKNPHIISRWQETDGKSLVNISGSHSNNFLLEAFLIYKFLIEISWMTSKQKRDPHPYLESRFFKEFLAEEIASGNLKI